jgi:ParB-like chromosome segregation protein Spo0J
MATENTTATTATPLRPIETRKLSDLKPHPRHSAIFHGLSHQRSRARIDDLIEDIRQRGLDRPIEVTVKNVVIDGHLRIEALRRLGRQEVAVHVRRDLGRDRAAIDRRHLQINADPSRFDQLERVHLAVQALEIERGRQYGELLPADQREFRTQVAEILGSSGSIVADYITIATAPQRVQEPFVMGRSSRAEAVRQARSQIASGVVIPATVPGGVASAEVASVPPPTPSLPLIDRGEALRKLIDALVEGMSALSGPDQRIRRGIVDPEHNIRVLRQFADFSREWISKFEAMSSPLQRSRQPQREP